MAIQIPTAKATVPVIDATTIRSLLSTLVFLYVATTLSQLLLRNRSRTEKLLFTWHMFDALIHLTLEAGFLYHCFFSYKPGVNENNFLSQPLRHYGPRSGTGPLADLWKVYAAADSRWERADLNVIGIELLTVFGAGPLALGICEGLRRGSHKTWFWIVVLATGELYGGFMTFIPEWLSGNPNLDGSNWMYLWLYLVFFNMLWVFIPIWAMTVAYSHLSVAPTKEKVVVKSKKQL